jgi:hypothetical protein
MLVRYDRLRVFRWAWLRLVVCLSVCLYALGRLLAGVAGGYLAILPCKCRALQGRSFNPKIPRASCFELHTLKFITEGANALIVGKLGTGKSHVAKALAYQATLQGYYVRYLEADTEFARYALAG